MSIKINDKVKLVLKINMVMVMRHGLTRQLLTMSEFNELF